MKHLKAGALIFIAMLILQAIAGTINQAISGVDDLNDTYLMFQVLVWSVVSLVTTFIAMCSVEYIQHSLGYIWDWLDVLSGLLVPICFTLIITLSILTI